MRAQPGVTFTDSSGKVHEGEAALRAHERAGALTPGGKRRDPNRPAAAVSPWQTMGAGASPYLNGSGPR